MKKSAFLLTIAFLFIIQLQSQDTLSYKEIFDDTNILINLLETSHPDPYSPFGGKVFFKLEAQKLVDDLPDSGIYLIDYQNYLNAFLSKLHDGHTYINKPKIDKKEKT